MNLAKFRHRSLSEGPWRNTTVWTTGCSIRCRGCFNVNLWDPRAGHKVGLVDFLHTVLDGRDQGDKGLAVVGGEPFDQPLALGIYLMAVKLLVPELTITVYTGFTLEALWKRPKARLALRVIDFLVDGPFVRKLADDNLGYRGSSNQRVIDLVKTRSKRWGIQIADWDNLVVIGEDYIAGPEHLLDAIDNIQPAECGRIVKEVFREETVHANPA
jgi:anaerobic ribonucleoside-triphosphate reductase activating protein